MVSNHELHEWTVFDTANRIGQAPGMVRNHELHQVQGEQSTVG